MGHSWDNFYVLLGTASATLTGLMFIAMTFGSGLVTKDTAHIARAFTAPAFSHFVQVLLISCLFLIPTMVGIVFGILIIVMSLVRLFGLTRVLRTLIQTQRKRADMDAMDWLLNAVGPLACYLLLLLSGIGFMQNIPAALNGLAIGTILILLIGIQATWELLAWMAIEVGDRNSKN